MVSASPAGFIRNQSRATGSAVLLGMEVMVVINQSAVIAGTAGVTSAAGTPRRWRTLSVA